VGFSGEHAVAANAHVLVAKLKTADRAKQYTYKWHTGAMMIGTFSMSYEHKKFN
jgi:hypothetical protein